MSKNPKTIAASLMEVHMGEDYSTILIDGNPVATKTYPSDKTNFILGGIAGRYNVHKDLVEALQNSNVELQTAYLKGTSTTNRAMIKLRIESNNAVLAKAMEA